MANPAELLFNQFTEWRASDKTAMSARSDNDDLALHRRAIQNLNDIRSLLLAMENAARAFTYDGSYTSHPPGGLPGNRTPESFVSTFLKPL